MSFGAVGVRADDFAAKQSPTTVRKYEVKISQTFNINILQHDRIKQMKINLGF